MIFKEIQKRTAKAWLKNLIVSISVQFDLTYVLFAAKI